ncbi:nuclear transport factor 2 family protein [Crocosphaera sp. UHCC 0190]|uniref:nuclear transport factor 2 family protein n=1 Tax=Crocosphaera sp. UHCC 0190 TaxID=3110246 RepID=UPI002B21FF08|nr:nuclear transport factor 2 family protein [Crocosphaera sp. UHCC 0190]MEA5511889.1 nuclear transport factor 2 family protein [Crocosphaera sp. UHCC 0190]
MNNLEVVQQLYQWFSQKQFDQIRTILSSDIEWIQNEGFPGGSIHYGIEEVLSGVLTNFKKDWKQWNAVVKEWFDSGHAIICLGYYEGIHKKTGKLMKADFAHVYWLKDLKIYKFQQFTDTLMIQRATEQ